MSAPMVRAILCGTKRQTRRVAKLTAGGHVKEVGGHRRWHPGDPDAVQACPYGGPGTALWVREMTVRFTGLPFRGKPWPVVPEWRMPPDGDPHKALLPAVYDNFVAQLNAAAACVTVPSIHMPRWASRLTLELTGVRIQRLQDITYADVCAEGVTEGGIEGFALLWDTINGEKHPWAKNEYVWVVGFAVRQP